MDVFELCSHIFCSSMVTFKIRYACYDWLAVKGKNRRNKIWQVIWLVVMLIIWNFKNKKIFEGSNFNMKKIKDYIIFYLLKMARVSCFSIRLSYRVFDMCKFICLRHVGRIVVISLRTAFNDEECVKVAYILYRWIVVCGKKDVYAFFIVF